MGNGTLRDERLKYKPKPGVLVPFEEKLKDYEKITGDEDVIRKAWENIEEKATRFVWMVLTDI
ncbi:MAG: hypothetical protein GTO12_13410 [Proteobacteria bacterium]|nr:hypothetical protein [Pseudomonadota bacterium]